MDLHAVRRPSVHQREFYLLGVCLIASLGGLLFGFDTAVISGTVSGVTERFELDGWKVGWFASSALLGCILGAVVAGGASDKFGRKPAFVVAAGLFLISAIGSAVPPSYHWLIVARIIGGVGVGIASVIAPTYIAEFAPAAVRGRLIALYQLSIVIGILCAYVSNFGLNQWSMYLSDASAGLTSIDWLVRDEVWRGMFGAETIPAAMFLILLCLSPESPRWLIINGYKERGMMLLRKVQSAEEAEQELRDISAKHYVDTTTWLDVFKPKYRRALVVGVGLSVFGQLTGVNVVVYFGPSILSSAGFAVNSALAFQVGFGLINLVFTLIALSVIDSWGRRPLLVNGMFVVSVMLLIVGGLYYLKQQILPSESTHFIEYGIVASLAVYFAAVALSICAVIWVLTPEVFPNQVRGSGVSVATFANWGTNALSVFWFPIITEHFSMYAAFFLFSGICFVATCFFHRVVPETRGRSLEDIEANWLTAESRTT